MFGKDTGTKGKAEQPQVKKSVQVDNGKTKGDIRQPAELGKKSSPVKDSKQPVPAVLPKNKNAAKGTESNWSLKSMDATLTNRVIIGTLSLMVVILVIVCVLLGMKNAELMGSFQVTGVKNYRTNNYPEGNETTSTEGSEGTSSFVSSSSTAASSSSLTSSTSSSSSAPKPTPSVIDDPDIPVGAPMTDYAVNVLRQTDWGQVLVSQQPDLSYKPSTVYASPDLIKAVQDMVQYGVGSQRLWFGDGNDQYGLVGVASFIAQAMHETIKYDACDENNWDMTNGYSAANACGQLGQAYDKYECSGEDVGKECKVNPNKVVVASSNAKWYGAPGPLFAAPKSIVPKSPRWNYNSPYCDQSQVRQKFSSDLDYVKAIAANDGSAACRMYSGQKAGGWELCNGEACPNHAAPNFGVPARTDVEGCYFWGRGSIQLTGKCNVGKLNWYAGKKAADDGRQTLYPDVDFCENPEEICNSSKYPELKWVSGLFYWMNSVQDYDDGKFNFKTELKKFVDSGMPNPGSDSGFIHGVSGIVNRGCADSNCGTGSLDGGPARAQNFEKVLKAMKLI